MMPIYKHYRVCFVPSCRNTTKNTPQKMFLHVPQNFELRNKWFQAVRRIYPKTKSGFFCCEDHFDLREDMENYLYYTMMGGKAKIKVGVVPHKFVCKPNHKQQTTSRLVAERRQKQQECQEFLNKKKISCQKVYSNVRKKGSSQRAESEKVTKGDASSTCNESMESMWCKVTFKGELYLEDPSYEDCTDKMTLPNMEHSPGEVVNFDHLTLRVGNAKMATSYFITRLGFEPFAYRESTDDTPVVSYAIRQNKIILIFESAVTEGVVADEVHAHGDFVKDIAFAVSDLDELVGRARAQGAELVQDITEESDDNGLIRYAVLRTYGHNTHTLVDRSGYTGPLFPGYELAEEDPLTQILPDTNLTNIDHVEGNMADGTLKDSVDWYEKNLNMKRFWCVDYEHDLVPFSCIRSESVVNRSESVLLSFNEAAPGLRPTSKATEFVKAMGSPGVEHIALYTDDIVNTMRSLKSRGADILTWPSTYYDLIQKKLQNSPLEVRESVQELREQNILIDFDEGGYMLQAFTKHLQARPTLFVEIIQRRNHMGFGAMNYKWVFQAIELLQIKQEKD